VASQGSTGGGSSNNLLPVVLIAVVVAALGAFALFRWRRRPAEE
jgi:LPXTG-motif cell wall-anchored protein